MKVILLSLLLLHFLNISHAQKKPVESLKTGRIEKVINSNWTFNYFPSESAGKGYESPGFNDSRWPAISIPHTWNSYETTGELLPFTKSPGEIGEPFWWTGWGWYRKHFSFNGDYSDHKVFIEFEGVQKYCKIWVNGKYAGDHKGGYGSFDFDITGFINPAGDNLIAVAVTYIQKDEFTMHPLTDGKFNVSCGIYRNVKLVIKNKLYIPMQGSAEHEGGTFISTPLISEQEATMKVMTWVKNDYPQPRACILQTTIMDQNNQVIQVIRSEEVIDAGQLFMFNQVSRPVKTPHLWSIEDPYLYTILSEVIDKKEVVDSCLTTTGFRWFRADEKDSTIYLNDKKAELKGVSRHQEYPWLGDAVPDWIIGMDYTDIRGRAGSNFIRTINYPGNQFSYQQSDKHGIIAEEDFSAIGDHNFSVEEQKQQLREMIRRDRNHPSIISWGVGEPAGMSENRIFASLEDSTRTIVSVRAIPDTASRCFIHGNKHGEGDTLSISQVTPARIIVEASHSRINADRGSLVIVLADITDSNGNHVPDADNTLRWKVTGPGKLAGPAYYVSYADSGRKMDEGWYTKTPATNIVRSSGVPGKIKVTVFSSGLASGSFEIEAVEADADTSAVIETKLADEGRKPVVIKTLVTERLEEIPQEISSVSDDFNLTSADKKAYTGIMTDFICKNNPSADSSSIELKTLSELFAVQLINNGGRLSADDYNFNIAHYNTCRLISGYIARTKLPPLFKESLRGHYAKLIIGKGSEKNAGDEMNWLNWIPSGGLVVIVPDESTVTTQKGVIFTSKTDLSEIIKAVYPQFPKFSEEARQRALVFISKMNPAVHVSYHINGADSGGDEQNFSIVCTAEKGQPILIPEYKFISE
ncbi:MAG: beta galactosidase jelly roll domain-containing protein [Bacteroidales bacterium]|nr:beta galactosidase jelly roll domain-containing protein [Bacteroidales bacterium]